MQLQNADLQLQFRFLQLRYNRYQSYSNELFQQKVNQLNVYSADVLITAIHNVINHEINEADGSLSKLKVLVVITKDPIPLKMIQSINHIYDDEIDIVNFSLNYNDNFQFPKKNHLKNNIQLYHFGFYQIKNFIRILTERMTGLSKTC